MKKILVIQTASIGDVILVTPVLEQLHQNYPLAEISLLLKKGNESLFLEHPFLKYIWYWDKRIQKYSNLIHVIKRVRRERFDLVINAQRFFSSGLITVLSGSGSTSGFTKNPLSVFFGKKVKHVIGDGVLHEAERNLLLIPGMQEVKGKAVIRLYPSDHDYKRMAGYQDSAYICISPASLWFTKQYPREKWAEFIRALPGGQKVYLLGSRTDTHLNNEIAELSGRQNVVNLAGQLTLLQSAALMEGAQMNYVNDSAPLHLCSSRNAPVTAVFCSTVPAFGFGPYGSRGAVVETTEKLTCRPCGLHGYAVCPEKHFRCALTIEKEQLINRLKG
ncbi:MAG: glycosyltransferase family 9 protein [Bacteroidetes bacterium]|nr:glycosyltransferase family 9 protein [Bacteroidota bacterium]